MALSLVRKGAFFQCSAIQNSFSKRVYIAFRSCASARPSSSPLSSFFVGKYSRAFGIDSKRFDLNSPESIVPDIAGDASFLQNCGEEDVFEDGYCNDLINNRCIILGKCALQSFLIEHLLQAYPTLDASKVADLAGYLTKEVLPLSEKFSGSAELTLEERRAQMYSEIGVICSQKSQSAVSEYIKALHSFQINDSDIDMFCKLAHPRITLDAIMKSKCLPFEVKKAGKKAVSLFINDEMVAEAVASTIVKAEYKACLSLLLKTYLDEVKTISLEPTKKVFEKSFKDRFTGQRVIEVTKNIDGHYGLYLKGGEKAISETDKFWRYNYIEPVYISKIAEGSPAAVNGLLQEGDVILAVGDFTLKGLTVESAIRLMNRAERVTLTVKYDPSIKIKENFKSEFTKRESKAFKDTLRTDSWKKWHEAKAEQEPERYVGM